ncbi:agmatine deiminase family protein, partial [Vibrio sp. RC27]
MRNLIESFPASDNFRMPGENEAHSEIWMAWPTRSDNWRLNGKPAQKAFVETAITIAKATPVIMLVPHDQLTNARDQLPSQITIIEMEYNDSWMRDIGATYVVNENGERRGISWEFNAWGGLIDGLYSPWDFDNAVAGKMVEITKDDLYQAPLVLEGGSIHCDGNGTVYTTEECL